VPILITGFNRIHQPFFQRLYPVPVLASGHLLNIKARAMESHEVIGVRYQQRKKMLDRFTGSAAESADRLLRLRPAEIKTALNENARQSLAFYHLYQRLLSALPPGDRSALSTA
jgi:hypothetical protein